MGKRKIWPKPKPVVEPEPELTPVEPETMVASVPEPSLLTHLLGGSLGNPLCGYPGPFAYTDDVRHTDCPDCRYFATTIKPMTTAPMTVSGGGGDWTWSATPWPVEPELATPDLEAVMDRLDLLEASIDSLAGNFKTLEEAVLSDRLSAAEPLTAPEPSPPSPGPETLTEAEIRGIIEEFGHDPDLLAEVLASSSVSSEAVDRVDGRHWFDYIDLDRLADELRSILTEISAQEIAQELADAMLDPDRTPLR